MLKTQHQETHPGFIRYYPPLSCLKPRLLPQYSYPGHKNLRDIREDFFFKPEIERAGHRQGQGDDKPDNDIPPRHGVGAEQGRAKTLDHADHRVEGIEPAPAVGHQTGRIDHRRSIHEQLHDEGHGVLDVAVLDGQGGEPGADAGGGEHHDENQERQRQNAPGRGMPMKEHQHEQQHQGDDEIDQFGEHRGEGQNDARKVDLAQQVGFGDEAVGAFGDGIGEIGPGHQGGEAEQGIGHAVGTDLGEFAEDDGENDHGKKRLNDRPANAEHRLGVTDFNTPPDQEVKQIAILDQFFPVDEFPALAWFDDNLMRFHTTSKFDLCVPLEQKP